MHQLIIQAIGFLALLMFLVSYQFKSNRVLFTFQLIGSLLFSLQFFLLDAASGCLSLGLNSIRSVLLMKYNDWTWVRRKELPLLFCGLYLLITIYTWAGPLTLLTLAASLVSTFCFWTNNARTIRLACLLCTSPCWLIYDVCVGSWGGVLNEAITILSVVISIFRFGWSALGASQKE